MPGSGLREPVYGPARSRARRCSAVNVTRVCLSRSRALPVPRQRTTVAGSRRVDLSIRRPASLSRTRNLIVVPARTE